MKRLTVPTFAILAILFLNSGTGLAAPARQDDNPNPPDHVVKLIFIHHSTGENWLTDDYGNLGRVLGENNYFVSDTNYGWGPDSIGDRTDIPNWTEWFRSENTPVYMEALFNESGQNSYYTRDLSDPGGENEIVMFKSCFPNSDLSGNPDDPPGDYEDMTVAGAKYVYNQILQYFAARPDKLFIVVTAPPLSDRSNAENARAFNNWLVNDWLAENDYPYNNVAVFDFYNVLTHKDAHHWYRDGEIQHITTDRDTLAYPSDDDHPSVAGSQKATDEFIPLLNIFYHRWQEGSAQLPPAELPAVPGETEPAPGESGGGPGVPLPPEVVLSIDDFEGGASSWQAYWDESTGTTISCTAEAGTGVQGSNSLRIDYSIAPGTWGTCALMFDAPEDWSAGEWLAFDIHSEQSGLPFNVDLYGGTPDMTETYVHHRETPVEYPEGYIPFMVFWDEFLRVEWEENAGVSFEHPEQVMGMAFGFDGSQDTPYTGTIWIDNVTLQHSPSYETDDEEEGGSSPSLPCLGSLLLPLCLIGLAFLILPRM